MPKWFKRKPKPTHYRVHVDTKGSLFFPKKYKNEMYLMDYEATKELFKVMSDLAGAKFMTRNNVLQYEREHLFNKWFEKRIEQGRVKLIKKDEYLEYRCYNFRNYFFGGDDSMKFNWTHWDDMPTASEVILGLGFGCFLGALFSGDLFGFVIAGFGVLSMLFGGIILGRDLEKDYSD